MTLLEFDPRLLIHENSVLVKDMARYLSLQSQYALEASKTRWCAEDREQSVASFVRIHAVWHIPCCRILRR